MVRIPPNLEPGKNERLDRVLRKAWLRLSAFINNLSIATVSAGINNVVLANGLNNDINIGGAGMAEISGPSASFSISGFLGGVDGRILYVYNAVAQQMTIVNAASSTAANQILTLTGANVVLRVGTSFASFVYDGVALKWILMSTN